MSRPGECKNTGCTNLADSICGRCEFRVCHLCMNGPKGCGVCIGKCKTKGCTRKSQMTCDGCGARVCNLCAGERPEYCAVCYNKQKDECENKGCTSKSQMACDGCGARVCNLCLTARKGTCLVCQASVAALERLAQERERRLQTIAVLKDANHGFIYPGDIVCNIREPSDGGRYPEIYIYRAISRKGKDVIVVQLYNGKTIDCDFRILRVVSLPELQKLMKSRKIPKSEDKRRADAINGLYAIFHDTESEYVLQRIELLLQSTGQLSWK